MTGDQDQAEDLAQEAFVRLYERGLEGAAKGLKVWLFRVVTNLARDKFRTRKTRDRLHLENPPEEQAQAQAPAPDRGVERREEVERVRRALDILADRDQEMLLLRQEGFSYKEIADAVEVAPGSVGTLLARALKRFAEALSREENHDLTS